MKSFPLIGVDATNQPVKYAKNVSRMVGHNEYFSVKVINDGKAVELITPKSTYTLQLHATANRYQGICNGHKVHVTMKKIVGNLIFW